MTCKWFLKTGPLWRGIHRWTLDSPEEGTSVWSFNIFMAVCEKKGFCCLCRLNASMWHDCKMKSVFSLNGADLNLQSNNLAWIQKQHAYTHSFITDINRYKLYHYIDVIMSSMASQFTCVSIVYLTVCSGADQRKQNQNSASLAFVLGIRRWLLNLLHKGPLTQKMFPFDDVIM